MQIRWQRRDLLDLALLVGIAAVATALRLAWVIRSKTFPVEGIDTLFYDERAQRLAAGFGYSYQVGTEGIPTGLFPPGYPFALAGWYKLFGTSLEAAQLFNVVISVVLVLAIYLLGRLALGRTEAIVGSLLWAVFPSQILWTSLLMPELLFALAITLSMVFVYVSSKFRIHQGPARFDCGGRSIGRRRHTHERTGDGALFSRRALARSAS